MAQGNSLSAGLRPRERFWLDHLRAARQQGQTLKAYAQTHGLSVSALYSARSTLKRRGALDEPAAAPVPTFVPVRLPPPPAGAAFRVYLPNGVVVEVASHVDSAPCAAVLECASRLS